MFDEYFELLKTWVDRMLSLQGSADMESYFRGGIFCPSCAKIHGRCGDAVMPLLYVAKVTGEKRYIEAAKELFDWSERNIVRSDDSYINDSNNEWRGITVFSVISLCEALSLFDYLLDEETRAKWVNRLARSSRCLYFLIDTLNPNVNYPISTAAALVLCGKYLKKPEYTEKGHRLMHAMKGFFNEDYLIYGEGKPSLLQTAKGCQGIDIGYNVEESLVAIALYCLNMDDQEIKDLLIKSLYAHLPFFIPDGGWNNSWGTRNAKWSYWGSRTSDGCQLCYGLMDDVDPIFGEIAYRNFKLYQKCTQDGLLLGGPMYAAENEPACIHHTFCHSKGLALMLALGHAPKGGRKLDLDGEVATRIYQNGNLAMLSNHNWKASISTVDYPYCRGSNSSGGCITFLWNKSYGPVLAATMVEYSLHEPANMQIPKKFPFDCNSVRITKVQDDGREFSNLNDMKARMEINVKQADTVVKAKGFLADIDGNYSEISYEIEYILNDNGLKLSVIVSDDCILCFPIISESGSCIVDEYRVLINGNDSSLTLNSENTAPSVTMRTRSLAVTEFNPVGGFRYIPIEFELENNQKAVLTLS